MTTAHGYKAFLRSNDDNFLHSKKNNYSFEIGKTYTETEAVLCSQGFHYCDNVQDVFKFYPSHAVVCKVTDLGDEHVRSKNGEKSCTKKLRLDHVLDGVVDGVHFKNGLLHSPDNTTPTMIVERNGAKKTWSAKRWYKNGQLHRDNDLPAVEWYGNGLLHREHLDGDPKSQCRFWYVNGLLHRDNGLPAIERANGQKEWWIHGRKNGGVRVEKPTFLKIHAPLIAIVGLALLFNFYLRFKESGKTLF